MKKVMVGMSGGVDSSVAAIILMEKGYLVSGATMNLYDGRFCVNRNQYENYFETGRKDAKNVCRQLGIQHYEFDLHKSFDEKIVQTFINSYEKGVTPNPCVECNRVIKFGEMMKKSFEMGQDYIATGHYSKIEYNQKIGRWLLMRPEDKNKDQTYMLYNLTQEQLSKTLMPVGKITKDCVRQIAKKYNLKNAEKPDSQDICFVPNGDYVSFIEAYTGKKLQEGDFIDINRNVLGKHKGIVRYTTGQRKGLGIAFGKPQFVIDKSADDNTVTLGDEQLLFTTEAVVTKCNFISMERLTEPVRVTAKVRYRQKDQSATIIPKDDGNVLLRFDTPQRAITRGQSAVFYDRDIVVGGGVIL